MLIIGRKYKMKKSIIICLCLLTVACGKNSGITPMADDVLFATRQAASGFSGVGTIKADLLDDARIHCQKSSEKVEIIRIWNNEGPFIMGNFPRAEIEFRCK